MYEQCSQAKTKTDMKQANVNAAKQTQHNNWQMQPLAHNTLRQYLKPNNKR